MRVLPFDDTTAPRLPFEKSYSFFIPAALLRLRPANGNYPDRLTSTDLDDDHHDAEDVRSDRDKALLTGHGQILDRHSQWVSQDAIAFPQRKTCLRTLRAFFL